MVAHSIHTFLKALYWTLTPHWLYFCSRPSSWFSPNLHQGIWQISCNRKVKHLVYMNSFGSGREVQRSLSLWTQLQKMQHGGKTDLLIEKRNLSDFGRIISLPNAENAGKSVSLRSRSFCAFVPSSYWDIT